MKWFRHDTNMHRDLKIQVLMEKHGLEGYGIFNLCLEMVGEQGKKGKLGSELRWREALSKVSGLPNNGKLGDILNTMSEVKLICPKSFKYGNLYIPNFVKRSDDYTQRKLRLMSEHHTDKVHVDKIRIDKIIEEYIRIKNYPIIYPSGEKDKGLISSLYKRNFKVAKDLCLISNGDIDKVKKSIIWFSNICDKKGLSWSLETILKWYPEYLLRGEQENKYSALFGKE